MSAPGPDFEVVHETRADQFAVHIGDETAVLEYQRFPDKVVFTHTGVPRAFEGKGVGNALAKTGLEWARAEGLRVIPICPFVAAYIARHPEYVELTRR